MDFETMKRELAEQMGEPVQEVERRLLALLHGPEPGSLQEVDQQRIEFVPSGSGVTSGVRACLVNAVSIGTLCTQARTKNASSKKRLSLTARCASGHEKVGSEFALLGSGDAGGLRG